MNPRPCKNFLNLISIPFSGPDLAMGARLLSVNRTQSRVVTGVLTGHNTLRRHLYVMGLCNDPMCRKCGTEEETSVYIMCECEALASQACLSGFLLFGPGGHAGTRHRGHMELC